MGIVGPMRSQVYYFVLWNRVFEPLFKLRSLRIVGGTELGCYVQVSGVEGKGFDSVRDRWEFYIKKETGSLRFRCDKVLKSQRRGRVAGI